jgi:secondary thiamine-phosphate synthase enzyme
LRSHNFERAVPDPASEDLVVQTSLPIQFIDVTGMLAERLRALGFRDGVLHVQTRHTTTGLVLNENEPLLLGDLQRTLERLVPDRPDYAHDDIERRGMPADEPKNAAAHCRALLLPGSQSLIVRGGELQLGRWQSLFLVELDGPRRRNIALAALASR